MLSAIALDEASAAQYWSLIKTQKMQFIHGYPSAITSLAQAALKDNDDFRLAVRGIFPVSEGTLQPQQELLAAAFPNATFLPMYGLSERVAMARYDPSAGTYHFYPLYGLVEILDSEDQPVSPGERGRIIATGLRLAGMPLLRYDTGDTAELVTMSTVGPVVRAIRGRRAQEQLITKTGGTVSIAALNLHSVIYEKIFSFRIRQIEPGEADLLIVPTQGANDEDLRDFAAELERNCHMQIKFRVLTVSSLPPTPNSKVRLVEQLIPSEPLS
jgi:phenylacetate-CoA ligase